MPTRKRRNRKWIPYRLRMDESTATRLRSCCVLWDAVRGERVSQGDVMADATRRLYRCLRRLANNRGLDWQTMLREHGLKVEGAKFTGVPDKPIPRVERDGA